MQSWSAQDPTDARFDTFAWSTTAQDTDGNLSALDLLLLESSPESLLQGPYDLPTDCCLDLPHDTYSNPSTSSHGGDHVLFPDAAPPSDLSDPHDFFRDLLPPSVDHTHDAWSRGLPVDSGSHHFALTCPPTAVTSAELADPLATMPPTLPAYPSAPPTTTVSPRSTSDAGNPPSAHSRASPSSAGETAHSVLESSAHRVAKRQRNTEAARRYRQRKLDRTSELEEALQAMTRERDDLRLKLARAEAEADTLRKMVGKTM